ncbi:helix-turn-helix domain-containing protein [Sphingomonas sp. Tas61C01]|uniref:helix-turn-helix domain-containing protein n=1 Tax=Sphingomonas sp. Tas61C01 TaxID=3458297 RepID=UPI00403EA68B
MPANADPPPFTSAPLHAVVADLVDESGVSQRDLVSRVGLSKDQLSRTLKGSRHMSLEEAATILHEAGLPARGTLTLALFDRQDLATDWARSGLGGFLEMMVAALPDALAAEIGDTSDRVDPRWGTQAARFVAQRIAHHIHDLIEREQRLGDFSPGRTV